MFQLLVTRVSSMLPVVTALALGALLIQMPSALLLLGYAMYCIMRAGGMGSSLGYRELARLDTAFVGGLLVMNGIYALICRGIAASGVFCLTVLTWIFVRGFAHTADRPGWIARAVIAFAWAALIYRFLNPRTGGFWWGCCTGVG